MHRHVPFLAWVFAASGCAVDAGAWDHVRITEAWLDRFDLSSFSVVAGTLQGDALLVFTEPDGNASSIPVHLGGGVFGAAMDLTADPEGHEGPVVIHLGDVADPTVGDVFGTYHGTGMAGAVFMGKSNRRMRNGAGASFREDHFVVGLAVNVGYQWVTIREGGNDGATNGTFSLTTPPGTTGDTGPVTLPESDTSADTGVPGDTAGVQASSGCAPPEDETTVPAEPPESSSSSSCGDSSGCMCSTGGAAPFGFTGALVLLRFRHRRAAHARLERVVSITPRRPAAHPRG